MAKTKKKKTTRKKSKRKFKWDKKARLALAGAVAVLLVLLAVFIAVKSHQPSHPAYEFDKETAYGIDVSSHNGKIDWKTVKDEVDFAFIRVGYRGHANGSVNLDKKAKYNLKHANKNGIPVGVYFYSQAVNDEEAEEEAAFLLDAIKEYEVSLPVVIDFEYAYSKNTITGRLYEAKLTKAEKTSLINAFCKRVKQAGYTPGVYASTYIYESHINPKALDKDTVIWVADYNESITFDGEYDIWQSSEKGSCKGVSSKYVDTDYWYIKE